MFSGPLPDKFIVPTGSLLLSSMYTEKILIDQGYKCLDYLTYSLRPPSAHYEYNNLFILGGGPNQIRKSIHHPIITPIQVFEKINTPERNTVYSEEELDNIIKMLKSNDKDIIRVALTICSKMNLEYIVDTKLGYCLKNHGQSLLAQYNDCYTAMIIIYACNRGF